MLMLITSRAYCVWFVTSRATPLINNALHCYINIGRPFISSLRVITVLADSGDGRHAWTGGCPFKDGAPKAIVFSRHRSWLALNKAAFMQPHTSSVGRMVGRKSNRVKPLINVCSDLSTLIYWKMRRQHRIVQLMGTFHHYVI